MISDMTVVFRIFHTNTCFSTDEFIKYHLVNRHLKEHWFHLEEHVSCLVIDNIVALCQCSGDS